MLSYGYILGPQMRVKTLISIFAIFCFTIINAAVANSFTGCKYSAFDPKSEYHRLTIPDGNGSFPVVVISHGGTQGGFLRGYQRWVDFYKNNGVATFFVDSIKPRACKKINWQTGDEFRRKDLPVVLSYLKSVPRLNVSKIIIQGHSAGSSMSLPVATGTIKPPEGVKVIGTISLYPAVYACQAWGSKKYAIPTKVFIGTKDIPAIKCWQQTGKEFVDVGAVVHGYDTAMRSYCRKNRYQGLGELQFCMAPDEAATAKTQSAALEFIKSLN